MRNLTWKGYVLLLTIVIEDLSLQSSILFNCPYQEAMWTSGVLLLLSHVSRVQHCVTPYTPAHQAPVPGILRARTLEWVAIFFSSAWKWKVKLKLLSHVWLLATPWTVAYQAPPSMGFPRQEYWSGLPLPSPDKWCRYGQRSHMVYVWMKKWDRSETCSGSEFCRTCPIRRGEEGAWEF